MHKFLIYLSVYFCLTCFGLSFSPSSEAGLQFRQWFKSAGYGVSARRLSNNIKMSIVAFELQYSFPFLLFLRYKLFHTSVKNINVCKISIAFTDFCIIAECKHKFKTSLILSSGENTNSNTLVN
jgi:hypothetical protein